MKDKKSTPQTSKPGRRGTVCRAHAEKGERMPGFCPLCAKPVDIIISEDVADIFGVCSECGNTLFYAHKLLAQGMSLELPEF